MVADPRGRRSVIEKRSLRRLELLGRLSSLTEELEEIANHPDRTLRPRLESQVLPPRQETLRKEFSTQAVFYAVCLHIVVKGLLAGRYAAESYVTGKLMGLKILVKNNAHFKKICRDRGLEVTLIQIDEENVSVQVKKGLTSSHVRSAKRPICHFEAGLLSGLIERWKKRKVNLREVTCSAVSGRGCKFASGKMIFDDKAVPFFTKGSLPLLPVEQYSDENIRLLTSLASHALTAIENTLLFEKTKRQSLVDILTGVYNHRYFQQALRTELKRAERHAQPISLLMIDLDNFKKVNDAYGHPKGDRILKALSQIFVSSVREIDIVARYGGDEFMIILPQSDRAGAMLVAKRVIKRVSTTPLIHHDGKNVFSSVSIGMVAVEKGRADAQSLIEAADTALRKAKRSGKGRVVCKS